MKRILLIVTPSLEASKKFCNGNKVIAHMRYGGYSEEIIVNQ